MWCGGVGVVELLVGVGVVGGGVLSFWAGVWVWRVGWGWRLWGVGGLVVGGWLGRLVWATRGVLGLGWLCGGVGVWVAGRAV